MGPGVDILLQRDKLYTRKVSYKIKHDFWVLFAPVMNLRGSGYTRQYKDAQVKVKDKSVINEVNKEYAPTWTNSLPRMNYLEKT